jgi:hypothetical protein
MVQTVLIGLVAGVAAALLFLAPVSGSVIAFPLFVLTGLPLAIATFGWGAAAGAIAAVAAAAAIFSVYPGSFLTAAMFLCLFGIPVTWLAYFSGGLHPSPVIAGLVHRNLKNVLVQLAATVVIALVAAAIVSGYDPAALVGEATTAMVDVLNSLGQSPAATADQVQPFVQIYVNLLPFVVAGVLTAIFTLDLWIGALVARGSGRMLDKRAPLWTTELPGSLLPVFVIAVVFAFFPGAIGATAKVVAGAVFCSFVLVGLAILHAMTRGSSSRLPILVLCYILLIFSGLPAILLAVAGATDPFLRLRQRRSLDQNPSH